VYEVQLANSLSCMCCLISNAFRISRVSIRLS
jgi:hypothetical protein